MRLRIPGGNLWEKGVGQVQADRRHQAKFAMSFDDVQGPVDVTPFILLLTWLHHPNPAQTPAPPMRIVQADPRLIQSPNVNPASGGNRQSLQVFQQVLLEGLGGGRVLLVCVRGAAPSAPLRIFPASNTPAWHTARCPAFAVTTPQTAVHFASDLLADPRPELFALPAGASGSLGRALSCGSATPPARRS